MKNFFKKYLHLCSAMRRILYWEKKPENLLEMNEREKNNTQLVDTNILI